MTKQEFLAASLPYGLMVAEMEDGAHKINRILNPSNYDSFCKADYYRPIVRPLESLTEECIQDGYNDGKPFIPIIELVKMCDARIRHPRDFKVETEYFAYGCKSKDNLFWYDLKGAFQYAVVTNTKEHIFAIRNQLELFQQLLKWHFWPNIPKGEEVIYVSESFNPRK